MLELVCRSRSCGMACHCVLWSLGGLELGVGFEKGAFSLILIGIGR